MKRFTSVYKFELKVWIKLNATLWPRTQEDKEQVSTRLCRFFLRLLSFRTRVRGTIKPYKVQRRQTQMSDAKCTSS